MRNAILTVVQTYAAIKWNSITIFRHLFIRILDQCASVFDGRLYFPTISIVLTYYYYYSHQCQWRHWQWRIDKASNTQINNLVAGIFFSFRTYRLDIIWYVAYSVPSPTDIKMTFFRFDWLHILYSVSEKKTRLWKLFANRLDFYALLTSFLYYLGLTSKLPTHERQAPFAKHFVVAIKWNEESFCITLLVDCGWGYGWDDVM